MTKRVSMFAAIMLFAALTAANATVAVSPLYGNSMVLQRGKPVPVTGTAAANKTITVVYNGQTKTTTSDAQGNWLLTLDAMAAKASGSSMTITEAGGNTITLTDVVVGDVWICSGQSNMDMTLGGCNRQAEDVDTANFPGIRQFFAPYVGSGEPTRNITGSWTVCTPTTAGNFTAVGFYFARKIYQSQGSTIPIGLFRSSWGGTCIDPWVAPEGASDIPALAPLYSQSILPWGPFILFNGMIYPYSPLPAKGALWYQGEAGEATNQSPDSYYLKEKAIQQGWRRLLGQDDLALYVVELANCYDPPTSTTPDYSWPNIRQMQEMVVSLPHGGMGSALDVGEADNIHPKDKLDVGERLALWALKDYYGQSGLVTSGPILKDTVAVNSTTTYPTRKSILCSFDYVGAGLMVGSKTPYQPTQEVVGGTLQRFVIAGSTGSWYAADAVINGNTVEVSSSSVGTPTKVAYAYWMNPSGANLYNRDGLPASPFCVEDVTAKYTVTASAGTGGSISPVGTTTYLKRRTALYAITPSAGYFIKDVTVDGTSVGSVKYYTFDPLYANHAIAATFDTVAPSYTINTSSTAGGSISPSGPLSLAQGGSQIFKMVPNTGCRLISVTLDGAPLGCRSSVVIGDVRTAHSLSATFAPIPTPGTGTGLRGEYFVGQNFDVFRSTRTDANINFDWGAGSPIAALPVDSFSVRWQGMVEPQFTETYKFYLSHDDGAKLWVNNTLVVNNWGGSSTGDSGTIALTAGVKVPIKIEYYDYLNNASCKLEWSSPSLLREVVSQTQLYPATDPIYTITTSAGTGGSFNPSGTVLAYSGSSSTLGIVPSTGYGVANVIVDGASQGAITTYTFNNITANHTISATFSTLPAYAVSGKVVAQSTGTGISGATVGFYTSTTSTGAPAYSATTDSSGNYSISVPMGTWYVYASATNYFVSSLGTVTVNAAPVTGINFALLPNTRNIPRTSDLLFSVVTDSLPASGTISSWSSYLPSGQTYTTMASPTAETIHSVRWEQNSYADTDGFKVGTTYTTPIPVNGASIVVAARPALVSGSSGRNEIVDVLYDQLGVGIAKDTGLVQVARNGWVTAPAGTAISDSQATVISYVVQPNGNYKVWVNGTQIMSDTSTSAMTQLYRSTLNGMSIGRNQWDGWSTFNGYIGDVFVYKVALTDAERQQLENDIASKFGIGATIRFTITASAGAGGSISPTGGVVVSQGASQSFTVTPNTGYAVSQLTVDGVNQGALYNYTFPNVQANHTISVTFVAVPTYTITASAGAGGSISPSGSVTVSQTANQTFTITPNAGYAISQVAVDGVNQGAISSYTFTNVQVSHTISATFVQNVFTITASSTSNGSVSPSGAVSVNRGGSQTFTITANSGYAVSGVTVDGVPQGPITTYTFTNVTADHTISATFSNWSIPRTADILFACSADDLPASGAISSWLTIYPTGGSLTPIGTPVVETINGKVWEQNLYADGDGFQFGSAYTSPIAVNGASIVAVVKPLRNSTVTSWTSAVDIFQDRLVLGVRGDQGWVTVRRNGSNDLSSTGIPNGQATILSLVVQLDGTYKVYANGALMMDKATNGAFTSLTPGTATTANYINVGRDNPYTWSTFNGNIGDVYVYKVALSDSERYQLESGVAGRYGISLPVPATNVANIAALKACNAGDLVKLTGTATVIYAPKNASGTRTTNFFYIAEKQGIAGLKVVDKISDTLTIGNQVTGLTGYVRKPAAGEAYLELTTDPAGSGNTPIRSLGINNKAALADPHALTNVIVVWGKVTSINGNTFTISDGYGSDVTVNVNGVTLPSPFDTTRTVVVTGILSSNGIIQAQAIVAGP